MRLFPRALGTVVIFGSLASGMVFGGCKRSGSGSSSGNNPSNTGGQSPNSAGSPSTSGNGGTDGQQQTARPGSSNASGQNQTRTQPEAPAPQPSVSGQPSADSDRGSPDAVAHRSVAQPGAPQGTVPNQTANQAPRAVQNSAASQH